MATKPKSRPTVSIIVPAFNSESYIAETLQSALAQTFDDFEVLVVDDGSTDRTVEVAERFALIDERVRVIQQSNQGVSIARNSALAVARGEFLALLDSDDVWRCDYLTEQLRVLREWKADIVSANASNLGGPFDESLLNAVRPGVHLLSLMDLIDDEQSVCIFSVFHRRVFEGIGRFDRSMSGNEDYDYWLRAAAYGFRIVFNATPLGWYRRRPDSLSANEIKMLAGIQRPLRKLRERIAPGSLESHAIDQKLTLFERRRLIALAKAAILGGKASASQEHFDALYRLTGRWNYRFIAIVARQVPALVGCAYALKRAAHRPLTPIKMSVTSPM